MNLQDFIDKLEHRESFSFSRWGDGEWNAVFGVKGQNCDGHKYFTDMGRRLREILSSKPTYILGLQPLAVRIYGKHIENLTKQFELTWINSDVFHNANMDGSISKLWDCLGNKKVLIVGPKHLDSSNISKLFPFEFYQIPSKNCWIEHDRILNDLNETIKEDHVVLFCASMMTNVLVDELHEKCTLIDFGSVLDPYVGVNSRRYHKKLNIKK